MSKIKILPDVLASKIAAGEVVERPSSVVKELIENSLDAGAKKIKVVIESGGRKLISVTDDGVGMSKDDALMSLERHATSKISSVDDLFSLSTLGFRGEALPSIASVSRFKLLTKNRESSSGVSIIVEGGSIKRVEDSGCPVGTTVEVRNLFFNALPRLKFLKTNETEFINIIEAIQRESISNPGVTFEVHHNGRLVFRFASKDKVLSRIQDIVKNCELYEIHHTVNTIEVSGYMSSPFEGRSNTQRLYTYVNQRPVKDRFITRMIMNGYGKMLPSGRFPQGALFINVPKSEVDVNVHPTKHEIKFRQQGFVGGVIKNSITEMLSTAPWILEGSNRYTGRREHFSSDPVTSTARHFVKKPEVSAKPSDFFTNDPPENVPPSIYSEKPGAQLDEKPRNSATNEYPPSQTDAPDNAETEDKGFFENEGDFSGMKIIGQVGMLYIVCETHKGIVLIDQHAAHERINYELLRKTYLESGKIKSQELLMPDVLDLPPKEMELFHKHQNYLTQLGFESELFGSSTIRIKSTPAIPKSVNVKDVFTDILLELDELGESKSFNNMLDLVFATMSCHGSIRANEVLDKEKIKALLISLDKTEFASSCPHGRPVAKIITYKELEKMFGRT